MHDFFSIASTPPHPLRPMLIKVSLADYEFDEQCEGDFGLRLELGGESLEREGDNAGVAEGKRESGVLGGVGARNDVNMRVT
jgi:hypothetical protein